MGIVGIVVVAACICALEAPKMWRRGETKELWLFVAMLLAGTGAAAAINLDVRLPSPVDWVGDALRPLSRLMNAALGVEEELEP